MGLATRLGFMGALVGGMTAELRAWETERANRAEELKQQRLEALQMEREQRAEARTIAAEGRADTRTIASEGREDTRWNSRLGKTTAAQKDVASHSSALSYGNQSRLQNDSQEFSATEAQKQRASAELIAGMRNSNDTDKPIRLLVENQSGQQQLIDLQPGEAIPAGWRAITTNNASSPMPSGSKTGTAPRTAAPGAAKPAWTPPQDVTVRQVR